MLLALQLNNLLEEAPTLVEVPDVVGDSQATGTSTLETALFAVAINNAYSDTVPVGDIISQSPTAGSSAAEGSTVTLTISLGPIPPPPADEGGNSGGWLFLNQYQAELKRRKALEAKRKALEEETEEIQEEIDRRIAQLLRKQEAEEDERDNNERLVGIAKANADYEAAKEYSERVEVALKRVVKQGNYSAIKALERELQRAQEEEEMLLLAIVMFSDD